MANCYNPVVKNGTFLVEGFGRSLKCVACDSAHAKYKFYTKFNIAYTGENLRAMRVTEIVPTLRQNDLAKSI